MALRIYKCDKCGKTLLSLNELKKLEGWSEVVPDTTDAAVEKHVPVVTVEGNEVTVSVGSVTHPMTAEHLIEWVAVEKENGYEVKTLQAGAAPVVKFALSEGEKVVAVYAYCNLHGAWKNK